MDCPNCSQALSSVHTHTIKTTECLYCEGRWLNGPAVAYLLEQDEAAPTLQDLRLELRTRGVVSTKRQCADCASKYLTTCTVRRVELDICSKCVGVFFDPGEIEKILPTTHEPKRTGSDSPYWAVEGLFLIIMGLLQG